MNRKGMLKISPHMLRRNSIISPHPANIFLSQNCCLVIMTALLKTTFIMNSDQTVTKEAVRSGSILFAMLATKENMIRQTTFVVNGQKSVKC